MYAAIIALAVFAAWLDRQDWECPDIFISRDKCEPGIGMPIRDTKPKNNDTYKEILDKVKRASEAERQNIKWRKSVYLSVGICFALFVLIITPGTLPEWTTFYTSVITSFAMLYMHFNWYSYHRYSFAEKHIKENIDKIYSKL